MKSKVIAALVAIGMMASIANATVISKNGIAKDSVTGLEWQDNEPYTDAEKEARGEGINYGKAGNWEYAKQYCENLSLGGKSDWRLPNIYELATLLDNTKIGTPNILDGFQNIASFVYWTSATNASDTSRAWGLRFKDGDDYWYPKTSSYSVRCVRAGQLNFDSLILLKKKGKLKVEQKVIDNISPAAEAKRKKQAEIAAKEKVKKEAEEQAERDRQAEYDRKHQCDSFYPGKNFTVHTTGLFGGDQKARVNGVDKDGGQVSFEWYDGNSWRAEEASCTYLKTQMR